MKCLLFILFLLPLSMIPVVSFSQESEAYGILGKFQKFYNKGDIVNVGELYSKGAEDLGVQHIWNEKTYKELFFEEFGAELLHYEYEGIDSEGLFVFKLTFTKSIQKMTFDLDEKGKLFTCRFTGYK